MEHDPSTQGAREQDHVTSGVFRKKNDAGNLHMFFSPNMVPSGLTDDEVGLCLELHERKEKISKWLLSKKKVEIRNRFQRRFEEDYRALEKGRETLSIVFGEHAFSLTAEEIADLRSDVFIATYWPISLPRELIQSPMTEQSFALGMRKLIDYIGAFEQKEHQYEANPTD